jgi:hypothetical protein
MSAKDSQRDTSTLKRQSESRIEDLDVKLKWYQRDEDSDEDNDRKWEDLEHHGVTFPDLYQKKNLPIKYEGAAIQVSDLQEELAVYWAQTIGSDWEKN